MDSTPTASAPGLSGGTKYSSSSSSLRILQDTPSSAADVVVVLDQLDTDRRWQEGCCERLIAAKLPARILTFTYDAQPPNSMNRAQGLTSTEAAAVLCRSLCSEREASGKKDVPIILFTTTSDIVDSTVTRILSDSLVVGLDALAKNPKDINSISLLIKRSLFGVLYHPVSPYKYRQRVLETAILSSLQAVIIIVLHIYKLYCDSLFDTSLSDTSWPIWPLFPFIGFLITTTLSERPFVKILFFWIGIDLIFPVMQDSPALLFVQKALKYTLLGYFALGYVHLATMQFDVNRNDQLQWMFTAVGISAVITKHWLFAANTPVDLKAFTLLSATALTASMVFSALVHCVWIYISNDKESEMEKKMKTMVRQARTMVPGDGSLSIELVTVKDNMSKFTHRFWARDLPLHY